MTDGRKKQWIPSSSNYRAASPVSDLVSKLLDPVIERRAGMTMDLIASWEEIVGTRHASLSRPQKLNWPRRASEDDPFQPATLIVACESSHALFMQHDSDSIISKVNVWFGFAAVARLRFEQKPLAQSATDSPKPKPTLNPQNAKTMERLLEGIEDEHLKAALSKMGRGVFSRNSGSDR